MTKKELIEKLKDYKDNSKIILMDASGWDMELESNDIHLLKDYICEKYDIKYEDDKYNPTITFNFI